MTKSEAARRAAETVLGLKPGGQAPPVQGIKSGAKQEGADFSERCGLATDWPGLTVVRGGDKLNFPAANPALNSQRIQTQFEGLRRKYGYGTGSTRIQEFH